MKKSLIKGFILGAIFVFSIILFSNMMNKDLSENTTDLEQPTLPVMYMQIADILVNPMNGYQDQMQVQYVRDCLTPLSTTRELTAVIHPHGNTIKAIAYEVLSADGSQVIENAKVSNIKKDGDYQKSTFNLEQPILMNQEYMLKFTVDYGKEKPVYYYTRLVHRAGLNTSQYLEFVEGFYEKCISKDAAKDLISNISPADTVTATNFTKVTINSSFDQLTWGNLQPTIFRKAIPVIKEINETTCSISQSYDITSEDAEGNTEYYGVTEFYRMRYIKSKVALIDYDRNAQQIFDGELPVVTSQGINLGVVDKDLAYISNQNADIIAFVQSGDLWSYNRSANKAAKIFSFREKGDTDERLNNNNHGVKIVRVEESGDVDFVVYGYMGRGIHEGRMGVSAYHYSAERNVTEELIFIPYSQGYSFLADDVATLSFVNKDNMAYLFLEDNLYRADLSTGTYEVILEDIQSGCFVSSKTHANAAWMDEMQENGSSTITIRNLERGSSHVLKAEDGQKLKALGFINEDFIYGIAKDEDIVTDGAGNTTFAMNTVRILSFDGSVIREDYEEGVWVSGAVLKEGSLELERVKWQENAYVPVKSEEIMNNLQTSEETVSIHLSVNERKGTQVALDFSKSAKSQAMLVVNAKYLVPEESKILDIDIKPSESQLYYVYGGGKLNSIHTEVNDAIRTADEHLGVVLNTKQQYIWERGNQKEKELINVEQIPEVILTGTLDEKTLQEGLGSEFTVLNLTGCSLESVLYQVNMKRAVVALMPSGESVVIVGYDVWNTILYNPETKETYYWGKDDSKVMFEEAGNVFLGYINNLETETKK